MPGPLDVWNRVHLVSRSLGRLRSASTTASTAVRSFVTARHPRRAVAITALAATFAVGTGGLVAYGVVHKTVLVDVDGTVTRVSTYAGSVDGVLRDRGIDVGARDTVAPEPATALGDGAEIVVRHATLVEVQVDGTQTEVWTTALNADEALATLATRGDDVRLVASRSASGGRAELPIDLTVRGPVDVVADGVTRTADGSRGLPAALAELDITLTALDRVSVQHAGTGTVTVVVNRVVVQDISETQPIAFTSTEQPDPNRYIGKKAVTETGVDGVRTLVNRVTTVDAVETARELISDTVTVAPVNEVVSVGTKVRPVVVPRAATPAAAAPAAGAVSPNVGGSADSLNWGALAACESGGRVDAVSSNGLYHGLYQFSVSTWGAVGGSGLPSQASADEQTMRAKSLYNRSGAGQWPHCGPRLFS